jgi:ribosomal protein L39E
MAYVKRIPLKHWKWHSNEIFGVLLVYGWTVVTMATMSWQFRLRSSMTRPEPIGSVMMTNGLFPVWMHKGHLWVTDDAAVERDIRKMANLTKPRYDAKAQWWWAFTDPSLRGMMESMDRTLFGLKQRHDLAWKSLDSKSRSRTRKIATATSVRDNRHIPQWVKIHVVLRDKGKCVYCSEDDVKLLQFDHRRAWSKGGTSKNPLNICLGCENCNLQKSDGDWGWG